MDISILNKCQGQHIANLQYKCAKVLDEATLQSRIETDALHSMPANSDSDEESCSQSPIVDTVYQQERSKTLLKMTYFNASQFQQDWNTVFNYISENMHKKSGK